MGKGATGKKAAQENRAKVYKYYSRVNPNGTITEGAEALNMHRHTVTKHCHALLEEKANGADLEELYGEPVTVQSIQATRTVQTSTSPKTAQDDLEGLNGFNIYKENPTPEEIMSIPWKSAHIKRMLFDELPADKGEEGKAVTLEYLKMGNCLRRSMELAFDKIMLGIE